MALQSYRSVQEGSFARQRLSSGDLFPDGVGLNPANATVQATVRPEGWLFASSTGYPTVRVGKTKISLAHPHGRGIHFSPVIFAEDVGNDPAGPTQGPPLLVDPSTASKFADVENLPNSSDLDHAGRGELGSFYLADDQGGARVSNSPHGALGTVSDMGDRSPGRPLTRAFHGLSDPLKLFNDEYRQNPLAAVALAGAAVGVAYMIGREFDRAYTARRGRGVAAGTAAVPAAGVATAGASVHEATRVANTAVTAAGQAADTAVSAAGDAVEAAGKAAETVADATADAVKAD